MSAERDSEIPFLSEAEAALILVASEDIPGLPDAVLEAVGRILQKNRAQAWEEGYEAAEHDEKNIAACNARGGPVSDCDCQVLTPNPYEEEA